MTAAHLCKAKTSAKCWLNGAIANCMTVRPQALKQRKLHIGVDLPILEAHQERNSCKGLHTVVHLLSFHWRIVASIHIAAVVQKMKTHLNSFSG
jgi:hypothetical protein